MKPYFTSFTIGVFGPFWSFRNRDATWQMTWPWPKIVRLLAVFTLVLISQLGDQTRLHVTEGITWLSCASLNTDRPAAFTPLDALRIQNPTLPPDAPEPHAAHHVQCPLAPALTVITLAPLLIVLLLRPTSRLIPRQITIVPRTPPPQFPSHSFGCCLFR